MKKSLLALAVLGAFAGSASAQSSVTMYGWLDVGYQWNQQGVNAGGTTAAKPPVFNQESVSGMQAGYWNGNRWGVRGSEKISDNLNAIFQLEAGFSIDTGAQATSGILFNRQSYLGLSGNWGSVVAGRLATPSSGTGAFDMFGPVDPFETGWGINSLGQTFISANGLRADNALAYVSPTWAGFKLAGVYSWNLGGQETAPNSSNTQAYSLGASYSGLGGLYAVITYDTISYPTAGSASTKGNPDQTHLQIGATYDFKFIKIAAAYADQSDITTLVSDNGGQESIAVIRNAVGNYNNSAWMLGATVPIVGNKYGTFRISYQVSDAKNIQRNGVSWEPDYNVWGIGWSYDFSNRTRMYVGYGQRSYDGNISGTVASGTSQGLNTSTINVGNAIDRDQFAIGLNHRF